MAIHTAICDRHRGIRTAIRALLEAEGDIDVVAEAATANGLISQLLATRPDVVLIDVDLLGRDDPGTIADLLALRPGIRVIVLSVDDDFAYLRHALAAGAHGYVLKETAADELALAIREVAARRTFVDSRFLVPLP